MGHVEENKKEFTVGARVEILRRGRDCTSLCGERESVKDSRTAFVGGVEHCVHTSLGTTCLQNHVYALMFDNGCRSPSSS